MTNSLTFNIKTSSKVESKKWKEINLFQGGFPSVLFHSAKGLEQKTMSKVSLLNHFH